MNEKTYDEVLDEKSKKVKQIYWHIAFGLQEVDGLKPSKHMIQLSNEHINGKKTYNQVQDEITTYYLKNQNASLDEKEADEVSTAIYKILSDKSFRFDYLTYKNYHKKLFQNLDSNIYFPGEFRTVNLTKKEDILDGDTVDYQSYDMIEESLKYDFLEEKNINYTKLSNKQLINRISEFTSRIWQVHPFYEGNTRTTAVFIQKYLISMGFDVNNDLFKDNSIYFRNALVRANYTNYNKGVNADKIYLNMFFENLLFNQNHILSNENLYINNQKGI